MNDLLAKISSYNFLNNLLPGAVFCFVGSSITGYKLVPQETITALILYYFVGLIISRVGSILIENLLKRLKIISFAPYEDYIKASRKDTFLKVMVETNNTYRTIVSLVFCLILVKTYSWFEIRYCLYPIVKFVTLGVILIVVFMLSYRKQTNMIKERIECQIKE